MFDGNWWQLIRTGFFVGLGAGFGFALAQGIIGLFQRRA